MPALAWLGRLGLYIGCVSLWFLPLAAKAGVSAPSTTSTGNYTVSWTAFSEIPGRRELLFYEVRETFGGNTTKYNNDSATSKSFSKSLNGSYAYTVVAYVSNINPVTYDDTVTTSTMGSATVSVQKAPTVTAGFSPTTISEGGQSTLSWSSINATGCSATGIAGVSGVSGSQVYHASSVMSANTSVTVNVTCTNAYGSTSDKNNVLTINYVNDKPTISNVGNKTISEDGTTGAVGFTVSDEETSAASLVVTATSSNTALVPNGNIILGGSGGSRTVTVAPVANGNGSATITLTVSDGNSSASDSFVLTVNAVNDAPTLAGC